VSPVALSCAVVSCRAHFRCFHINFNVGHLSRASSGPTRALSRAESGAGRAQSGSGLPERSRPNIVLRWWPVLRSPVRATLPSKSQRKAETFPIDDATGFQPSNHCRTYEATGRVPSVTQRLFTGVGVALVTLFGDDGRLDAAGTAQLAGQLVELGVRAVVVAGSTGEASALSPDERSQLLALSGRRPSGFWSCPSSPGTVARHARRGGRPHPPGARRPEQTPSSPCHRRGVRISRYYGPSRTPLGVPRLRLPLSGQVRAQHRRGRAGRAAHLGLQGLDVGRRPDAPHRGLVGSSPLHRGPRRWWHWRGRSDAPERSWHWRCPPELCQEAFEGSLDAPGPAGRTHLTAKNDFPAGIKGLTADRFGTPTAARL